MTKASQIHSVTTTTTCDERVTVSAVIALAQGGHLFLSFTERESAEGYFPYSVQRRHIDAESGDETPGEESTLWVHLDAIYHASVRTRAL